MCTIAAVPERRFLVTPELLSLCRWVADYYAANLSEVLQAAVPSPAGLTRRATRSAPDEETAWLDVAPPARDALNQDQRAALEALEQAIRSRPFATRLPFAVTGTGSAARLGHAQPRDLRAREAGRVRIAPSAAAHRWTAPPDRAHDRPQGARAAGPGLVRARIPLSQPDSGRGDDADPGAARAGHPLPQPPRPFHLSPVPRLRGAAASILGAFRTGQTDFLLGTQMVAKGFDFPMVTLVGIIVADLQLYLPDFRAAERTFQLLTQVAGRAGRGDRPGEVILQSYDPDHPALRCAAAQDFEMFYEQEAAERQELNYPPFGHLVEIEVRGAKKERVVKEAGMLRESLERAGRGMEIELLGPA